MAKDYAKQFYRSAAWEKCRASFIASRQAVDGGMCQRCGKTLGYIVHHKDKITEGNINDASITLSHNNLEYVCKDCHDKIHDEDIHGKRESFCGFDANGMPIDRRGIPPI